jgi:glycine/D-amino acid oxidase-like deaminating enzyme
MPRLLHGVSPWADALPAGRGLTYPRLTDSFDVPVAIVGGGLTGVATAYALAAASIRVVLVEADRIGRGATLASDGLILADPGASYREHEAAHGRRAARAIWQATRRASLEFQSTIRRLGIRSGLAPLDRIVYAASTDDARVLAREVRARKDAGLDASTVTSRVLAGLGVTGALGVRTRGHARVHPVRLCLGLARAAAVRGAGIFEASPATRLRVRRRGVEITAGRGLLTAERVIVATGEAAPLIRALARHFMALETYAVMTPALPASVRNALRDHDYVLQETHEPPHRLHWIGDDRIVWSGADQARTPPRNRDKVLIQRTGQLMYELSLTVEAISGIQPECGWAAPYSRTADGVPFIGPHRNFPHHLFAFGLGTNLAHAFLASRMLLREVLGRPDRDDAPFGFARLPR